MPWIAASDAVLGGLIITMRSPVIAVVDMAHHTSFENNDIFVLATIKLRLRTTIEKPVPKIGSTAITESIGVVCWRAIGDTSRGFGICVAECMRLRLC